MPKCKNDPGRTYKGTEPSPKGLGYCAHTHLWGSMRVGRDGTIWEVKSTKNGTKRWVRSKDNYEYLKYTSVRYNKKKDKRFFCKWDGSKCIDEMKYLKLVLTTLLRVLSKGADGSYWFDLFYSKLFWPQGLTDEEWRDWFSDQKSIDDFHNKWKKEAVVQLKKFIRNSDFSDLPLTPFHINPDFWTLHASSADVDKYHSEKLSDFDPWNMVPSTHDVDEYFLWFMEDHEEQISEIWSAMLSKKELLNEFVNRKKIS